MEMISAVRSSAVMVTPLIRHCVPVMTHTLYKALRGLKNLTPMKPVIQFHTHFDNTAIPKQTKPVLGILTSRLDCE